MIKRLVMVPLAIASLALAPATAASQSVDERWNTLEAQDVRLAQIAERIQIANAHLCRSQMPITGLILHSYDQYPEGPAQERFTQGPLTIAALVPGSPAERAGAQRDDGIIVINEVAAPTQPPEDRGNLRESGYQLLVEQAPDNPITLGVSRDDEVMELTFNAPAGCRTLVEIRVGSGPHAQSDGRVIQIRYDFALELTDEELAVVFAHELAHTVLEHRRRKEEAGIEVGLIGEFGRNQQANREAEIEADRMIVHLLANAGYDPMIAPLFFNDGRGRRLGGGPLQSWVYPTPGARGDLIEREIEMFIPIGRGPTWPGHLLTMRDRPFSRD